MQDVKLKIQSIVKSATGSERLQNGKTVTDIANDLGISNPSKSVVTELGIAIKKLNLKTKRTTSGRLIFCDDWSELYRALELV
jgi:hypothetical protein